MALDASDISKIAHLARLGINNADALSYAKNLSEILAFVEQLESVVTDDVEPMSHPFDEVQRLREDKVTEGNQRECFQAVAPEVEAGLYLVPRVID